MAALKTGKKGTRKGGFITGASVMVFLIIFFGTLHVAVAARFDYSNYAEFLNRYVVEQRKIKDFTLNVVDYAGIQKSLKEPGSLYENILKQFEDFDPSTIQNREDEIAFWICALDIPQKGQDRIRFHTAKRENSCRTRTRFRPDFWPNAAACHSTGGRNPRFLTSVRIHRATAERAAGMTVTEDAGMVRAATVPVCLCAAV